MNPLKHNDILHSEDNPMRSFRQVPTVLFLTGALLLAGLPDPVHADGTGTADPDADAAGLVEEVLRKAGGNDGGVAR